MIYVNHLIVSTILEMILYLAFMEILLSIKSEDPMKKIGISMDRINICISVFFNSCQLQHTVIKSV